VTRHDLKVWTETFEAIQSGRQTHFAREYRGYGSSPWEGSRDKLLVDDILDLREFISCDECGGSGRVRSNDGREMDDCGCAFPHGKLTGRVLSVLVTHRSESGDLGLQSGWSVVSIRLVETGGGASDHVLLRKARENVELRTTHGHHIELDDTKGR